MVDEFHGLMIPVAGSDAAGADENRTGLGDGVLFVPLGGSDSGDVVNG